MIHQKSLAAVMDNVESSLQLRNVELSQVHKQASKIHSKLDDFDYQIVEVSKGLEEIQQNFYNESRVFSKKDEDRALHVSTNSVARILNVHQKALENIGDNLRELDRRLTNVDSEMS